MIVHHTFKWVEIWSAFPKFKLLKPTLFLFFDIEIVLDGLPFILIEAHWNLKYSQHVLEVL